MKVYINDAIKNGNYKIPIEILRGRAPNLDS
jgi:hypothetical protein